MKGKITLITSILLLGVCTSLSAQNTTVKEIINEKYYSEVLKSKKIISTSFDEKPQLNLLPKSEKSNLIKNRLIKKEPKNIFYTYETLYFIPKEITVQKAGELARSISKMEGIKYYSTTKKKDLVLYKNAFTVENASSKIKIADKISGSSDGKTIYALLDDNSFGQTHYKISYSQSEQELLASFINSDDIGIGPIRAIMPEKLIINLLVIPCKEGIVVYLCADLESKKLPGIKAQITDSISSRIDAISKWFISLV